MKLKVKLDEDAIMPTRAHKEDAGLDLYARENACVYRCGGSHAFDTGVHIEIPFGYAGFLKSKSGLNVKHGITSDGTIDASYTGSIAVKLYNNSDKDYFVHKGDKITQIVIQPVFTGELVEVDELEPTERGSNGFGSTGR